VGHWLGLFHTFQGGCSDGDDCDDTPPVEGTFTNANCPANGNSCPNDVPNLPDMWENYMDYSNGQCMSAFTLQQIDRMNYFLARSPRNSNVSAANLTATGVVGQNVAPVAEFTASSRVACAGQSIKFYDLSCKGVPTIRSWTFKGAATPSSTSETPVVMYQTPGIYEVALTVQNSFGTNSISKTDYITILPAVSKGLPAFEEGFENGDPTTVSGFVHQSPAANRFQITSNAAYTGTKSYVANIATGSTPGVVYSFTTQSFDISKIPTGVTPKFTFYCSYVQPSADVAETMRIFISTDCGGTFTKIWERSGSGLSYSVSAPYANNFKPTMKSEWKRQGLVTLRSLGYDTAKNAIFRIDVLSGGGNPVYIDNINMSQWYAGNNLFDENNLNIQLSPNPAMNQTKLTFETAIPFPNTKVSLFDVSGRMVKEYFQGDLEMGKHEFEIVAPNNQNIGLYYLKIENATGSFTRAVLFGNE
jgi:PKD repeat protein